jgi:hypothetical protein
MSFFFFNISVTARRYGDRATNHQEINQQDLTRIYALSHIYQIAENGNKKE